MYRFVISIFALGIAISAQAAPSAEKASLGLKLATLLDYESLFTTFRGQCEHSEGTMFDPKELIRADPNAFGGIRPSSIYWPQIESGYTAYRLHVCEAAAPRDVSLLIGNVLAQELSAENLRVAIAFYSSAEGQRFQRANTHANEALRHRMEGLLNTSQSEAYKQLAAKLRSLVAEYQKNPK